MASQKLLADKLAQNSLRLTQPRQLLFDTLVKTKEPTSVSQLIQTLPQVNRASIYRSVTLFEQLGIVKRIWIGFKSKLELSDSFIPHHHHLNCTRCNKTIVIKDERLEQILKKISSEHRLRAENHQVEIHGICKDCY
jgi:Fur family ferric uptake transcriptional regulator